MSGLGPTFLAGALAGWAIALPVGAVATYLVGLAARSPWRVGAAGALGIATTDGVYALVAGLGGAGLARWVEPVAGPLRVVSVVVLLVLAGRTAWTAVRAYRMHLQGVPTVVRPLSPWRAWAHLLTVTAVNPATVLYFALVVVGSRAGSDDGAAGAAVFAAGAFCASAAWQLVLASGGTLLGRVLTGPRGRLTTALVSAGVMVALCAGLVVTA